MLKDGVLAGCGDVALRIRGHSSAGNKFSSALTSGFSSFGLGRRSSLVVFTLSSVACLRANSEEDDWGLSTLPNMTLYRSISTLGISTSRKGPPGKLSLDAEMISIDAGTGRASCRGSGRGSGRSSGRISGTGGFCSRETVGLRLKDFLLFGSS